MVAKNWKERDRSTEEMYGEVYGAVSQVPGLRVFPRLDPPLPTPGQYDVELVLQSEGQVEDLLEVAMAVVGAGWQSGKFLYVDTDLKIDLPEARVVIDRDQVADLGLDLASVGRELGTLLGGAHTSTASTTSTAATRSSRRSATRTARRSAAARPQDQDARRRARARLDVHAHRVDDEPAHAEPLPAAQRRADLRRRQAGRDEGRGARGARGRGARRRRPGRDLDHAGESRQIRREASALVITLGFAVILVYLVLSAQFRSFRDPLVVLLGSVPLAIRARSCSRTST
jgi:multidrug efflux pump